MTRLPFLLDDLTNEIRKIAGGEPAITIVVPGPTWRAVVSELENHFNHTFGVLVPAGDHAAPVGEAKVNGVIIRSADG